MPSIYSISTREIFKGWISTTICLYFSECTHWFMLCLMQGTEPGLPNMARNLPMVDQTSIWTRHGGDLQQAIQCGGRCWCWVDEVFFVWILHSSKKNESHSKLSLSVASKINRAHTLVLFLPSPDTVCIHSLASAWAFYITTVDILIWIRESLAFWLAKRLTKHDLACRFVGRDLRRTWDDRRSHLFQITVRRLQIAFQPKNVFSQLRYSN